MRFFISIKTFIIYCILLSTITAESINNMSHKVLIEAHRGVSNEVDENTNEAFKKAIEYGLDSIETDAWLTKDNVVVLVHDGKDISKVYEVGGNISDVTQLDWNTLKNIHTKQSHYTMPKLDDVMKYTKDKIFLNLEIKDQRVNLIFPYIIKLIEENNYYNQIMISSFNHNYYEKVLQYNKEYRRNVPFGFLYKYGFGVSKNNESGHKIVLEQRFLSKQLVEQIHKKGMKVVAWFFAKGGFCILPSLCLTDLIGEDEDYVKIKVKELIKMDVDVIITSYPKIAKDIRDNFNEKDFEITKNTNYFMIISTFVSFLLILYLFKSYLNLKK